jgi:hypothetical protein
MNKPLLLFIIFTFLFAVASFTYYKYCETKPNGCKHEKLDKNDFGPREGIDW